MPFLALPLLLELGAYFATAVGVVKVATDSAEKKVAQSGNINAAPGTAARKIAELERSVAASRKIAAGSAAGALAYGFLAYKIATGRR